MTTSTNQCARFGHDRLSGVGSALREDLLRAITFDHASRSRVSLRTKVSMLIQPPLLCLCAHRLTHFLWVRRWHSAARLLAAASQFVFKANIPPDTCIGPGCFLGHTPGTTLIGTAGSGLTLFSLAVCCPVLADGSSYAAQGPALGDRVAVTGHAVVIGPISVGDGVRLAPKSVLRANCPAGMDVLSIRLRHRLVGPS